MRAYDETYPMLRKALEDATGISSELPHAEAMRQAEAYQRKEADRRWRDGGCECCVGCPDAFLCPHCVGDFPHWL